MKGRRSSRGAAVVLAACVGLAVMVPGIAAASTPPATFCDVPLVDDKCPTDGSGSTSNETSTPDTTTPDATPDPTTPDSATATVPPAGSGPTGLLPSLEGGTGPADLPSQSAATAGTEDAAAITSNGEDLQNQINAQAPAGGLTGFVPGGGNLDLGDLPVVTTVPTGGFQDPQAACAYLAGGLSATPEQQASLGSAFESFCGSLPHRFGDGVDDLTGLLQDVLDLLNGLLPGAGGNGTGNGHGTVPPSYVPVYLHGYWTSGYDVDCADVTYAEAQELLSYDHSDPFRLDADDDGIACEVNRVSSDADDSDDGHPEGGVATGDGSTATEASPAMLGLAAAGVSGLALAGVGLVRRFGRENRR